MAVPARLSQVLTAFIIECDNEFEHRMPHRTTRFGSAGDLARPPWLVSMAMWANCLRLVPADGIAAGELARRARLERHGMDLVLTRMRRRCGPRWPRSTTSCCSAGRRRTRTAGGPRSRGRRPCRTTR
jgi:hypothetical protein